jgi:cytochrome c oxidase subunit 2
MRLRRSLLLRLAAGAGLLLVLALLTGCGALGGPQNTFAPNGDVADKQRDLFVLVSIIATVILIGVSAALVYIMVRYRRRSDDELPPKQIHGNTRLELAWTIAPALLLLGLAVPTVAGVIDLGRDPKADALHVHVIAFRFDWRFQYTDPEFADPDGKPLAADELHIPVDREVSIQLESQDVIHSFWVPKLAGKLDVMPGRNNRMWFNATQAGTYSAQCAEFCGIGHSVMKFTVVAQEPADFQAWVDEQLAAQ